jgi:Fe-S cluster biogenesis protein NfuA
MTRPDLEQPLARITTLIEEVEEMIDPAARERSRALVQAVLDVHGVALRRFLDLVALRGGQELVRELSKDDAVALLLALHGLHPDEVSTRVAGAVAELRPQLRDEGIDIELAEVTDEKAVVALRPLGTVQGNTAALRATIETAIARSAPEIAAVDITGLDASDVPLGRLSRPAAKKLPES